MGRFQGPILGCCGTTKRLHWVDISVHAVYAAGRAFIEGFTSPNIDRHGYTSVVDGASGADGHSTVQNERLKRVQGKHGG